MSDEHILVDGHNILHQWDELRPALAQSHATGRDALILLLTRFHDCHGGKLTLVFDGNTGSQKNESSKTGLKTDISVFYSAAGESADAVIERIVGQSSRPDQFLVATDDHAEQNLVEAMGARVVSSVVFHAMLEDRLKDLNEWLKQLALCNRKFKR